MMNTTPLPSSVKYNHEHEKCGKKDGERDVDRFEQAMITIGSNYRVMADLVVTGNPHAGESPSQDHRNGRRCTIHSLRMLGNG